MEVQQEGVVEKVLGKAEVDHGLVNLMMEFCLVHGGSE